MNNIIHQHGNGEIFTTPLFWICNCESGFLQLAAVEQCPHCKALAEESADADISLVLKHAGELPQIEVKKLINAINATDDDESTLEYMLAAIATDNEFCEGDGTGILYTLTIADVVGPLARMIEEKEIGMGELTGNTFQDMVQSIANNLAFDWEAEIRYRILAWQEIKNKKAEEMKAADEAFTAEARAAAAEAIADEHLAQYDLPDQEPWDGV